MTRRRVARVIVAMAVMAAAAMGVGLIASGCAFARDATAGVRSGRLEGSAVRGADGTRVTVTDDFGRRVTVEYPPKRIISLAPGATAMLLAAGAGNRIVATIDYSGAPASERRIPRIGNVAAIDMERLIAAKPDVVVVWPDGNSPAQIATIARLGIPIYEQESLTLGGIAESVRRLGRLAGTTAAADRAAAALKAKLALMVRTYGQVSHPPTAFLQVWDRPLYTVGGHELMSDALRVCGVRNVFGDLPQRAPAIGVEAVIQRDPDIIIAASPPGMGAAWLAAWKRFPSLKAVKGARMMIFEDQRFSALGPGTIDATAALCGEIAALTGRSHAPAQEALGR